MSIRLKVGFGGVLSCLVLVLALFFSTGVASAHGTQAAPSQASLTSLSTLTDVQCSKVYVAPGGSYAGRSFPGGAYVTVCGRYDYYNGYYGNYSGCSKVYVPSGYYRGVYFPSAGYVTVCGSSNTCKQVYVTSGFYQDNVYFSSADYIVAC